MGWFTRKKKEIEYNIHKVDDWGYETICLHCSQIPLRYLRYKGYKLNICPTCGCSTQILLGRCEWDIPQEEDEWYFGINNPTINGAINITFIVKPEGCQKQTATERSEF